MALSGRKVDLYLRFMRFVRPITWYLHVLTRRIPLFSPLFRWLWAAWMDTAYVFPLYMEAIQRERLGIPSIWDGKENAVPSTFEEFQKAMDIVAQRGNGWKQ